MTDPTPRGPNRNGADSKDGTGPSGRGLDKGDGAGNGAGNGCGVRTRRGAALEHEPLVRMSDYVEYRSAYEKYKAKEWDAEQWTAFRLRFGIYGQLQPGVQMIRIKIPGGILSIDGARAIARLNDRYAGGHKQIHVTTRQDIQLYFVPLDETPDFVGELYAAGLTTREACGNTLRNMNGCQLAGVCPREHVDAGKVAEQIAHMWLRQPLVQHMPRKFKVSVSGCETDCAASGIHDMGLVATSRDGRKGFILYGGGGTGGVSVAAVRLLDFVGEEEVGAALEALVRLHQRYSNRVNRNQARIKFLVKRFGEEKFRALFLEEFERLRALPQRPWRPLEWREPEDAPAPLTPGGIVRQHDGRVAVVVAPTLGLVSSAQLMALAEIAERFGAEGFRTTRDQNIILYGLPEGREQAVVAEVRALGLAVEEEDAPVPDVVSCPGTTTCRLGITNSQNFGKEVTAQMRDYGPPPGLTVKISGCQNGCGLHHVGDFGFRGMGKKIDGANAPHYQIYVGGNPRQNGAIGIGGPIVPARLAPEALRMLLDAYGAGRRDGESVRDWALRLGKDGLKEAVKPLLERSPESVKQLFIDWGESETFETPEAAMAECAAPFAVDNLLRDLADDGLIGLDRAILAGRGAEGLRFAREAVYYAARRLLLRYGSQAGDMSHDEAILQVRSLYAADRDVLEALGGVVEAETPVAEDGNADALREKLAVWIDLASDRAAKPVDFGEFAFGALGDSSGAVAAALRAQGAAE
jgi:sulfite reductase (NADPH) hemoprotein beta-component